jgi:hypothetical protein
MLSTDRVVGSWAVAVSGAILRCPVSHPTAAKVSQQRVLVWWIAVTIRAVETINLNLKGHVDVVHIQEAAPGVGGHPLAAPHRQVVPAPFSGAVKTLQCFAQNWYHLSARVFSLALSGVDTRQA